MSSALYIAKSANICGTAFTGLIRFTSSTTAKRIGNRNGDGKIQNTATRLTDRVETLTIELDDCTSVPVVGAKGSTTLKGVTHNGGLSLSGDKTWTAASSTVESVTESVEQENSVTVVVNVESADGAAAGIVKS